MRSHRKAIEKLKAELVGLNPEEIKFDISGEDIENGFRLMLEYSPSDGWVEDDEYPPVLEYVIAVLSDDHEKRKELAKNPEVRRHALDPCRL